MPKYTREQLERLAKNPHFRMSHQQIAELDAYREGDIQTQDFDIINVNTQEIRPTDQNVITPKVKRRKHRARNRTDFS